jgi:hypothetical protein
MLKKGQVEFLIHYVMSRNILIMQQTLTVKSNNEYVLTFYLLCHTFFNLWDDSDFHCKDCCFFSTLYSLTHVSVPFIISSIKFSSTSACWKPSVQVFHHFSSC